MTIEAAQNEIVDTFSMFADWEERYQYMIDLGKVLPLIDEQYKTEAYLIEGCQSNVWIRAEKIDGRVCFTADGDAIITKGIIALLIQVFSNQYPQDIIDANTDFIDKIGLKDHLSPTRANGLSNMIKQLKHYAIAYQIQDY